MRLKVLAGAVVALAAMVPAVAAQAAPAQRDVSPVLRFTDGSVVDGGWSALVRTSHGVGFTLHTSGLPAGDAVTIWWVVFNHPAACSHGALGLRCGEGDLAEPAVEASVLFAAGHVIGGSGAGSYGGYLATGDLSGPVLLGPGLTNPRGADIHLIVHDHGPAITGLVDEMIHSFGGGCANLPPFTGPNDCEDLQFSPHES